MNSAGVGLAALADTLLTTALIFSLHQSRTGIKRTDGIIDVLILYAINTGMCDCVMVGRCLVLTDMTVGLVTG